MNARDYEHLVGNRSSGSYAHLGLRDSFCVAFVLRAADDKRHGEFGAHGLHSCAYLTHYLEVLN